MNEPPTPDTDFAIPACEALQFKNPQHLGEDWLTRYLDEEKSPYWRYGLLQTLGQWTAFKACGDIIVIGKPHAIISPDERNEDGADPPTDRWELQFWPEEYFIVEPINKGLATHRIGPDEPDEYALFERAFAQEWEHINKATPGLGQGLGHLQDIIYSRCNNRFQPVPFELRADEFGEYVTQRERVIVADVIQWLGSGVGRGFLNQVNLRTGGKLFKTLA